MKTISPDNWILYHEQHTSTHPGAGAHDVTPAGKGEDYAYVVDRLWRVTRVNPDGSFEARGPHGNIHHVDAGDHRFEKVGWWRRYRLRHRVRKPLLSESPL